MNVKKAFCVGIAVLMCASPILAAGPRGRRMMRPRHRQSRFPVIVDYQSGAGWGAGRSVQWMPSGSATYANYPPGWRGPVYATVPPVHPAMNGGIVAPYHAPVPLPGAVTLPGQVPLPDGSPYGHSPVIPYHDGMVRPEMQGGGMLLPPLSPEDRSRPSESQIDGRDSSPGERRDESSTEL